MGGPTACGEGDITALGQQPGSMVIGVGWGGRGGVLDTGRSGPGKKLLRQAGTCQADPGGPWGEGREASSRHSCPHTVPRMGAAGNQEGLLD